VDKPDNRSRPGVKNNAWLSVGDHLGVALGVEAITAGYTVLFASAPALVAQLARANGEGRLDERLLHFSKPKLLIVDSCGVGSYVELPHEVGL